MNVNVNVDVDVPRAEELAARRRPTPKTSVARQALDLNAEGNVPDRAKAAREVTRQASLQAQKVYQSLEVAAHRPAVSEEFQKGRGTHPSIDRDSH